MNKTFRGGAPLYELINNAPIDVLLSLLRMHAPEQCASLAAPDLEGDAGDAEVRTRLSSVLGDIDAELARRLGDECARILGLGRERGAEMLSRVAASNMSETRHAEFKKQRDELGRSVWCFLADLGIFEAAESFQYATHFRDFGRIYAAFDAPATTAFEWSADMEVELKARILDELDLEGPVTLSHLTVTEHGERAPSHLLVLRHAGELSSVAEHRKDGAKGRHYYRPPNEIVLVYSPSRRVVEVCADSPATRQDFAAVFAETGLGQDLSRKPLSFKLYNLSRFRTSLSLPFFQPDGTRVKRAAVVEVEARPLSPTHRLSLKVSPEDDIEKAAERMLGQNNAFRRAAITRVVIAVQFWPEGRKRSQTLNITLSYPNNCNLPSKPDPKHRKLGYDLLEHWKILQSLRLLSSVDERALLPSLLEVYELGQQVMSEHDLFDRGFDVAKLSGHGFIEPAGRFDSMVIDEDIGRADLVEVRPGIAAMAEYEDHTGRTAWQPQAPIVKYAVNHLWIEDVLSRQFAQHLVSRATTRLVPGLISLGEIDLNGERVRCYLARGLLDMKNLRRIDNYLRGQGQSGIGLVFAAGEEVPPCLGANVVVPLRNFLSTNAEEPPLSIEALVAYFSQNRQRARGGMAVELVKNGGHIGVLYVPGKEPLILTGADQVLIFERLVAAYHGGTLVVPTGELMNNTGSNSPSQAFPDWKSRIQQYVVSPKKGYWRLAV